MNLQRNAQSLARDVMRAVPFVRLNSSYPEIADLAVVGDRRTAAVISNEGTVLWYSPGRFDSPSLIGGLLDPWLAGSWRIALPQARPRHRRYLERSAVLETTLQHPNGTLTITDWMNPAHSGVPQGVLCRTLTAAPAELRIVLVPRPQYGRRMPAIGRATPARVAIDERFHLHCSHTLTIKGGRIEAVVPKGERSWAVLSDAAAATPIVDRHSLDVWLAATLKRWSDLARPSAGYEGPWREQVHNSLRALHLLCYEETGALAAAVTTSLPEIVGGKRNYDYRYTWLRDSGIIVRALLRFEPDGETACRHLAFFSSLIGAGHRDFLDPVWTLGGERVPLTAKLRLAGYKKSRPVLIGNAAGKQLQLGSIASFLLGMKEIYESGRQDFQWEMVANCLDFLTANWTRRGHGIWEERRPRHFTSSHVFAVCALEGFAPFARRPAQAERWRAAAQEIRAIVERSAHNGHGAYLAVEGKHGVDISAALYPIWGYCAPHDPAMEATVRELERRYSPRLQLFHRHLESSRSERREGAFLAGTFWIAHYWAFRGELDRARELIDAGLSYANDLGLFSEEIQVRTGRMIGNFPLGLVHGSFLAAVADYHRAAQAKQPLGVSPDLVSC